MRYAPTTALAGATFAESSVRSGWRACVLWCGCFNLYRRAGYVDRVLKGETPANLPVQLAGKFELIIKSQDRENARSRRPFSLLARAYEVIE